MLRVCSKEEFLRYADFAYELALDPARSGYPTYRDGTKTREDFMERCLKAFERDTEEMLLFEQEGKLQGVIHYYWIPEDHYLQTTCCNTGTGTEQALKEFLAYIGGRFQGYDVYLGFSAENETALIYLAGQGFECIEESYNNIAFLEQSGDIPDCGEAIRISRENYGLFQALHKQIEGKMYWNSERILANLDEWIIWVKEEAGKSRGAIYYTAPEDDGWSEIFGIDLDRNEYNRELVKDLLCTTLADMKRSGVRYVGIFGEEAEEDAIKESGFRCGDEYICYHTRLD